MSKKFIGGKNIYRKVKCYLQLLSKLCVGLLNLGGLTPGVSMSWTTALQQLDGTGVVEFGVHQMNEKTGTPKWRRHRGGPNFRFNTVRSALFSPDKGARSACLGKSSYARDRYSAGGTSVVPYAAAWLQGETLAFLVRAGATEPEVTLVPASALQSLADANHGQLLADLARIFGEGAQSHGVRHLVSGAIHAP
jgi:hypothetical protein